MRVLAPDGPAIGLGHQRGKAASAVNVAVGLGHGLIALFQALFACVEAVGVLHVELADPDQPRSRSHLIAELGLNLIQNERKVAVALDVGPHHVGDDLLVGGSHYQEPLAPVL